MINLDLIISKMKEQTCNDCSLMKATFDETGESVRLHGSFCDFANGFPMILITAVNLDNNQEVWKKECDTGITCTIPFTSEDYFVCRY